MVSSLSRALEMLTVCPQSRKDRPNAIKHCQPWERKHNCHSATYGTSMLCRDTVAFRPKHPALSTLSTKGWPSRALRPSSASKYPGVSPPRLSKPGLPVLVLCGSALFPAAARLAGSAISCHCLPAPRAGAAGTHSHAHG